MMKELYLVYASCDYDTDSGTGIACGTFLIEHFPPTVKDVQDMIEFFKKEWNAKTVVIRSWMPLTED